MYNGSHSLQCHCRHEKAVSLQSTSKVQQGMSTHKEDSEEGIGLNSQTALVTFDDVLKKVGEFGRFQVILYLAFSLPYLETSMQLMGNLIIYIQASGVVIWGAGGAAAHPIIRGHSSKMGKNQGPAHPKICQKVNLAHAHPI